MEQMKHIHEVNSEDSARDNKNEQNETGENELENDELESVAGGAKLPYLLDKWYHVSCINCGYSAVDTNNFFSFNSTYIALKKSGCPKCGLTDYIELIKK